MQRRVANVARHGKTLREIMGLRDSIGDIRLGDTVRIVSGGHVGRVEMIGQHGLLSISGAIGPFAPWEVEKVIEKEKTA